MKITVLIENTTDSDLLSEHGLSLYIEYRNKRILLDAGSTDAFAKNASRLNVDMANVDMAFLSHGHYDHSGGLEAFVQENRHAKVYLMENALEEYASASGGTMHKISVPASVKEALKNRTIPIDAITKVTEGITLVPHNTPGLESIGERAGLYRERNGNREPDDFSHEMSVVFETEAGLVICNCCSHAGFCNIAKEVKAALPGKKIYAYVGGLHMKGSRNGEEICTFSKEEIKEMTDCMETEGIVQLITGHCTGSKAMQELEEGLENCRLLEMCSGKIFYIQE